MTDDVDEVTPTLSLSLSHTHWKTFSAENHREQNKIKFVEIPPKLIDVI